MEVASRHSKPHTSPAKHVITISPMELSPELTVLLAGILLTSLITFFVWLTRSLMHVSGAMERVSENMREYAKEMKAVREAKHAHANMLAVHDKVLSSHDLWLQELERKSDLHGDAISSMDARCKAHHG